MSENLKKLILQFNDIMELNKKLEWTHFPTIKIDVSKLEKDDCVTITFPVIYKPYGVDDYYTSPERFYFGEVDFAISTIESRLSDLKFELSEIDRLSQLKIDTLSSLTDEQKLVLGLK